MLSTLILSLLAGVSAQASTIDITNSLSLVPGLDRHSLEITDPAATQIYKALAVEESDVLRNDEIVAGVKAKSVWQLDCEQFASGQGNHCSVRFDLKQGVYMLGVGPAGAKDLELKFSGDAARAIFVNMPGAVAIAPNDPLAVSHSLNGLSCATRNVSGVGVTCVIPMNSSSGILK